MNRSASTTSLSREPKAEARVASLQDGAGWRPAIGLGLATLLLAGAVYAGIATGFAGLAYPTQAEGSLLRDGNGQVRGSAWLSQPFTGDGYFQARPSAANYDPMAAAGSNLARSNPALAERVAASTAAVAAREGVAAAQVPADLVTQSGGGLDPAVAGRGAVAGGTRGACPWPAGGTRAGAGAGAYRRSPVGPVRPAAGERGDAELRAGPRGQGAVMPACTGCAHNGGPA
jgi:K+-transporting ATPase ATPase C chain